jgi:hypothetical protein
MRQEVKINNETRGLVFTTLNQRETQEDHMNARLFESLPIGVIYVGFALLMLASYEVGYKLANRSRARQDKDAQNSIGPMVGGLLGMLGFVLAFTFSMAASQHDLRKQNVLQEANTIGTAYLRADLLDRQFGTEVKRLLREYVDIRMNAASGSDLNVVLEKSVDIHGHLWSQVSTAARKSPSTNTSLAIQSINDVIDMHEKRVTGALRNRIPGSVWIALSAITALTMITMGMQVGFTGERRLVAVITLSLAFAVLVTLVVDLNRPQSGLITVGQQAMVDLQRSMDLEAK